MASIAEFLIGIVGMVLSHICGVYLVRFFDGFANKKDRHEK